jgi:hypothetical protein
VKDLPEIAPEIRGLLEEIVADPRSSIRLAPRRALRSWFDTGETVRAREVSRTSAERHLIEAHREAVAQLLYEASRIAYWKGAVRSLRPSGPDGRPYDPARDEPSWRSRAGRRMTGTMEEGTELLRSCLEGIAPQRGYALAEASLGLVPRDDTRICLASHIMEAQPRSALAIFERTALRTSSPKVRGLAWGEVGTRCVLLDRLEEAGQAYVRSRIDWPHACFSLFNLACIAGRSDEAETYSAELGLLATPESPTVNQALDLIKGWAQTRSREEIRRANQTADRISLSGTARRMSLAYD